MAVQDLDRIEQKIDRAVAGAVPISDDLGGIAFKDMSQVLEFAKLMAVAETAIPKHLRGSPGMCLAVCIQALEWRMSPFSVANKSYVVNDRIAYEAQLIVAIMNARAPLKERLRYEYEGEGIEMRCKVIGHLKGETSALDYQSPKIKDIKVKNSPLWVSDPQQQLAFYSARAWARRHCPDVLLGIYSEDELRDSEIGPEHARDVTPQPSALSQRLAKGTKGKRGFTEGHTERALEHKPGETVSDTPVQDAEPVTAEPKAKVEREAEQGAQISRPAPDTDDHHGWRGYLDAQVSELAKTKTAEEIAGMTTGVKASLDRGVKDGELTQEAASELLGRWNSEALTRQAALTKQPKKQKEAAE